MNIWYKQLDASSKTASVSLTVLTAVIYCTTNHECKFLNCLPKENYRMFTCALHDYMAKHLDSLVDFKSCQTCFSTAMIATETVVSALRHTPLNLWLSPPYIILVWRATLEDTLSFNHFRRNWCTSWACSGVAVRPEWQKSNRIGFNFIKLRFVNSMNCTINE